MGLSGGNDEQVSRPEPLTAAHDLAAFACGAPTLDDWLRQRAVANHLSGVSRSYVLIGNGRVAGYYTLAAGPIAVTEAPGRVRRNSSDPIPVLGRLAIDQAWQGRGVWPFAAAGCRSAHAAGGGSHRDPRAFGACFIAGGQALLQGPRVWRVAGQSDDANGNLE